MSVAGVERVCEPLLAVPLETARRPRPSVLATNVAPTAPARGSNTGRSPGLGVRATRWSSKRVARRPPTFGPTRRLVPSVRHDGATSTTPTDATLIDRSLAGDDEAFVELLHRHEAAIWGYLARRAGSGPAEDLVSEVWIAAFRARATYDPAFPVARPWLFAIARNVLRRHWRTRPDEELEWDMSHRLVSSDPWPAVDERLHGADTLREALAGLRPAEREVLALVVWEELTVAEAARTVGIPAGTARYHLHRARMALRGALGDQPAAGPPFVALDPVVGQAKGRLR